MFGFLIAVGAGVLVPHIEKPLALPLVEALRRHITVEPNEVRIVAFAIMLIISALVTVFFGAGGLLGQALGISLGYFGTRIIDVLRNAFDSRSDG